MDLDRERVRAICFESRAIEMAAFDWAVYDEASDVGLLSRATAGSEEAPILSVGLRRSG
jgi:hypothetical protein